MEHDGGVRIGRRPARSPPFGIGELSPTDLRVGTERSVVVGVADATFTGNPRAFGGMPPRGAPQLSQLRSERLARPLQPGCAGGGRSEAPSTIHGPQVGHI